MCPADSEPWVLSTASADATVTRSRHYCSCKRARANTTAELTAVEWTAAAAARSACSRRHPAHSVSLAATVSVAGPGLCVRLQEGREDDPAPRILLAAVLAVKELPRAGSEGAEQKSDAWRRGRGGGGEGAGGQRLGKDKQSPRRVLAGQRQELSLGGSRGKAHTPRLRHRQELSQRQRQQQRRRQRREQSRQAAAVGAAANSSSMGQAAVPLTIIHSFATL